MRRADTLIVPATLLCALFVVLAATVSWVRRPMFINVAVSLGPPRMAPRHTYGLSFTPRNAVSGHILTRMDPAQPRCVPVVITNSSLTYVDERSACRTRAGSYKMVYRFPQRDDYILFIALHPQGADAAVYRKTVSMGLCVHTQGGRKRQGRCTPPPAQLRGKEIVRTYNAGGLTVVLGAPAHAVQTGEPVQASFVFLRQGRAASGLRPLGGAPGQLVAVSMDTLYMTRFQADPGQVVGGHIKSGAISFHGSFDHPSIYRLFGTFRYRRRTLRPSFVIDVNPRPKPTPPAG